MVSFKKKGAVLAIFFLILITGCQEKKTPRPRGYFRIELPKERSYQLLDSVLPYSFEYPRYAVIEPSSAPTSEPYWLNVFFPEYKARIHISYKKVENNLYNLYEDNIRLAYNHSVKADAINEQVMVDETHHLYGMLFEIKGNAASPLQFFATDSTRHFLRGSLYFYTHPNKDSLAPVINFLSEDVKHLMESIRWKN
jgi:gliding motility-associated lipoprotein GldD